MMNKYPCEKCAHASMCEHRRAYQKIYDQFITLTKTTRVDDYDNEQCLMSDIDWVNYYAICKYFSLDITFNIRHLTSNMIDKKEEERYDE